MGSLPTFQHMEISSCTVILFPVAAPAQELKKKNPNPNPVQRQRTIQLSEFIHLTYWILACFISMGVVLDSPILITHVLVYILDTILLVFFFLFFQVRFSPGVWMLA